MKKQLIASGLVGGLVSVVLLSLMAPRDGNGTYSLPAGNPTADGQTITANLWNTTFSDLATSLTASIAKDGQTTPTANLPMGGFLHTNVANATARTHYAATGQIQDASLIKLSSVAGTNTITGNLTPAITAYSAGMVVVFQPFGNNTGATTLAVNGLTALDVQKEDGDALASGDLVTGIPAVLALDTGGDDWILLNPQTRASLTVSGTSTLGATTATSLTVGGVSVNSASILTSGTLADARVAQSNVTQHQAALGSESATGSTIARRTASGYLLATYFNQSSGQSEVATPVQVFVETGSDGYLRKSSLAQLQDDLTTRNITGKAGVAKTLSTSAAAGGSDGDIHYRY